MAQTRVGTPFYRSAGSTLATDRQTIERMRLVPGMLGRVVDSLETSWVVVAVGTATGLALVGAGLIRAWRGQLQERQRIWEEGRKREQARATAGLGEAAVRVVEREDMGGADAAVEEATEAKVEAAEGDAESPEAGEIGEEVQALLFEVGSAEYEVRVPEVEMKPVRAGGRRRRGQKVEQLLLWPDADLPVEG